MQYVYRRPPSPSFKCRGLLGYTFGPLKQNLDVYYIEVERGHDTFMISEKITRTYYVLSGRGYFIIGRRRYDVVPGVVVEVTPNVEYTYSGQMNLVAFSIPHAFAANDTQTRWNPDVVRPGVAALVNARSALSRLMRLQLFGKSPVNAYLRLNQLLWNKLPPAVTTTSPMRSYGAFLHKVARMQAVRKQAFSTFFFRNRPQLQWIQRLAERRTETTPFMVAVLGCSVGAETYSIAWTIRQARPDLALALHAVDISAEAVAAGRRGVYPAVGSAMSDTNIFERMSGAELQEMFERDGDALRVKDWIRQAIEWHVADLRDPEARDALGLHDLVVANNFLCHMDDSSAAACLRSIAALVRPNGYLIVSGIDLDARTEVAKELGWRPVEELLEEIHEGDPCLRGLWPCHYGGLEPLDKSSQDWRHRYAAAFQVPVSIEDTDNDDQTSARGSVREDPEAWLTTEPA